MSGWRTVVLLGLLVGLGIVGCGKSEVTDQPTEAVVPAVAPLQPVPVKRNAAEYNVPFDAATVAIAPEGFELPPDKTFAGKPAAKRNSQCAGSSIGMRFRIWRSRICSKKRTST